MGKERLPNNELDPVRRIIRDRIAEMPGASLKAASIAMGLNESYLHQFLSYGTPRKLGEIQRRDLAEYLGLPERDLMPPGALAEAPIVYGELPPDPPPPPPVAAYEERELMGDTVEALNRLYKEELFPLNLRELGITAWDMHREIVESGKDLRRGLEAALTARRRWLRQKRAVILADRNRI